jgi:uroporphyrinogen decarboxylase
VETKTERKALEVLRGRHYEIPPVWMMRQAGRYLPEYKETRKKAGGFLDLCYTPELAIEVTLQPIRRFGFDASILFSDILVIPDAMGRDVRFEEGRGPVLKPIAIEEVGRFVNENETSDRALNHLVPVIETVSGLRDALPDETTLLGFCGAPWTIATYMIAGHGTTDQAPARVFSYRHPKEMDNLLARIADVSADYLIAQFKAGADAIQIFDSWAGVLGPREFDRRCVEPVKRIVERVRRTIPDAPIIAFPKGAGRLYSGYHEKTAINGLGLDWSVSLEFGQELQRKCAIQGNLDPTLLVAGGDRLDEEVDMIVEAFNSGPFIFNLGHGITPDTPIGNVERMLKRIRG